MLYLILAPKEVRIAMSDPTGWRPPIPLGEELQARVDEMEINAAGLA
jgi:hypothetical protein